MGGKKDINRVRELIFGKDIERFEKKFEVLEELIDSLEEQQEDFEKNINKQLKQINNSMEKIEHTQTQYAKEVHQQSTKANMAFKEMDKQIQYEVKRSSEQLKTLKTELKMYMKAKLNGMNNSKISHDQLAEMFANLSNELKDVDDTQRHVR